LFYKAKVNTILYINKSIDYERQNQAVTPVYLNMPDFEKYVVVVMY